MVLTQADRIGRAYTSLQSLTPFLPPRRPREETIQGAGMVGPFHAQRAAESDASIPRDSHRFLYSTIGCCPWYSDPFRLLCPR
jgi:hypothetical protein